MSFEPEKLFIGLVDFFSILMPGALVAYLGKDWAAPLLLDQKEFRLDGTEAWMVFLFASYLLGHFSFLLGAVLDDLLYDPLRSFTRWGQTRRLANGRGLSYRLFRTLASSNWLFGKNADAAVMQAQRIKVSALRALSAEGTINAFQWCKARLSKEHPEGLVAVQRFEANSKFFRSFVVILAVLALSFAFQPRPVAALACAGFLLLAFWRYLDQRFKATQHAYWYIIMLEGMKVSSSGAASRGQRPDGLTHAGGVVYWQDRDCVKYLLVQASKDRAQWVLPKGHIEQGEDPRQTAVREVNEETGHWARVRQWIEDLHLDKNNAETGYRAGVDKDLRRLDTEATPSVVRFYLMELVEQGKHWPNENRGHQWLELAEARQKASFDDTKNLLEKAATLHRQSDLTKKRRLRWR